MRLDKFLKVSRLVKRRSVANELAAQGRVRVNGREAKPGTQLAIGDEVVLRFGEHYSFIKVRQLKEHVPKNEANELYEIMKPEEILKIDELKKRAED